MKKFIVFCQFQNNETLKTGFAVSNKKCIFAIILMAIKLMVIKLFDYEILR